MANNQQGNQWHRVFDFMLGTNSEAENEDDDAAGDLLFDDISGDFAVGEDTTRQHQGHLLIAAKGDLRESPQAGVHLAAFLNSEGLDITEAQAEIELQLELDGQTVDKVVVDLSEEGNVQIDAGWEKE